MATVKATVYNKSNNPVGRGGCYFPARKTVDVAVSTVRFHEIKAHTFLEIQSIDYEPGADVASVLPDTLANASVTDDTDQREEGRVNGQATGGGGKAEPLTPYSPETRTRELKATSMAIALARKENVDLSEVEASDGEKVSKADVEAHMDSLSDQTDEEDDEGDKEDDADGETVKSGDKVEVKKEGEEG